MVLLSVTVSTLRNDEEVVDVEQDACDNEQERSRLAAGRHHWEFRDANEEERRMLYLWRAGKGDVC